jgi:hypothetical protein
LNQPAPQVAAQVGFGAMPDEAPLLIPIQGQLVHEGQDAKGNELPQPLEEVIQNILDLQEAPQLAEEQVLAMYDDTDIDSDAFQQVQLPILEVEIVPFPDSNNLQPLMPEEIQEEELKGWINGEENEFNANENDPLQQAKENVQNEINANENAPLQQVNENNQLGFVQVQNSWP